MAALQGKTMKAVLLEGKFDSSKETSMSLAELEALLDHRLEQHRISGLNGRKSASAIFEDVPKEC